VSVRDANHQAHRFRRQHIAKPGGPPPRPLDLAQRQPLQLVPARVPTQRLVGQDEEALWLVDQACPARRMTRTASTAADPARNIETR